MYFVICNFTHFWTFTPTCRKLCPFDDNAQKSGTKKGLYIAVQKDRNCSYELINAARVRLAESPMWIVHSLISEYTLILVKRQRWPLPMQDLCCWSLHCRCSAHSKCTMTNRSPILEMFKSVCVVKRLRVARFAICYTTTAIRSPLKQYTLWKIGYLVWKSCQCVVNDTLLTLKSLSTV